MSQTNTAPAQPAAPPTPVLGPKQIAWRAQFFQEKGWKSKQAQQAAVRGDLQASLGATLQPGVGPNCAASLTAAKLDPGKEFKAYMRALDAYEKAKAPRDPNLAAALKQSAEAYIAHYNGHSKRQQAQKHTLRKFTACSQTLDDLRRVTETEAVLNTVQWNSKTAMQAASLKAEADFASLPAGRQTVESLKGKGVNPAFWVNKAGANPDDPDKTFLFKPKTVDSGRSSIPAGGEPAREAMTGRAADILGAITSLDLKVPETHIISVSRSHMPDDMTAELLEAMADGYGTGPLVGSLQQFSDTKGEAREQAPLMRRAVTAKRCQELAMLDIVTLNVDRHGGNYLMTGDAKSADLVPIDNGLSFPETADDIATMGRAHNAMLGFPAAHQPFTPEMQAAIARINPDVLVDALKRERGTITEVHGDGGLSDAALNQTRRSTMFLKLAAATLSPAATQIAIGQNAKALLDPALDDAAFTTLATGIIQAVAAQQAELAEYFTASPDEKDQRKTELQRLNWPREITGSPQMAMALVKQGVPAPQAPPLPVHDPNSADPADIQAMKAAYPKAADVDLPKWMAMAPIGGHAELLKALDVLGVADPEDRSWISTRSIGDGLAFLQAYTAGKAVMANPNANTGQQRLIALKEALVTDLARLLPDPQKTQALQRLAALKAVGDVANMDRLRDGLVGAAQQVQRAEMKTLSDRAHAGLTDAKANQFDIALTGDTPAAGGCIRLGFVLAAEAELVIMRRQLQDELNQ